MTTTEWVERYNRAFLRAGAPDEIILESTPCLESDNGWPDWDDQTLRAESAIELTANPSDWMRKRWRAPADGTYSLNGVIYDLKAGDGFPVESGRLFGDPGPGSSGTPEEIAIPANPSPFEPKEVVDDGPVGQNVLNQKETAL